jgi:hypothetical protein
MSKMLYCGPFSMFCKDESLDDAKSADHWYVTN